MRPPPDGSVQPPLYDRPLLRRRTSDLRAPFLPPGCDERRIRKLALLTVSAPKGRPQCSSGLPLNVTGAPAPYRRFAGFVTRRRRDVPIRANRCRFQMVRRCLAVAPLAVSIGLYVETKTTRTSSAPLRNWPTAVGILVSLGVLGMTVGLIRSETAGDLRTLSASGASSTTRRTITGATSGALGLLAAVLGTPGRTPPCWSGTAATSTRSGKCRLPTWSSSWSVCRYWPAPAGGSSPVANRLQCATSRSNSPKDGFRRRPAVLSTRGEGLVGVRVVAAAASRNHAASTVPGPPDTASTIAQAQRPARPPTRRHLVEPEGGTTPERKPTARGLDPRERHTQ